ncbi:hypothetical protein F7725_003840 [Dissostichus mawsoni]|uniref:ADP-ribosylation factor-binding protein GGA1 n=1 Tax=Dissostichus mawsoni TaxID=36200 RepID=A0A7J5YBC0_DISMA|nr:hypothetical protein F7725_003840 [Dissostichus mawsoni]
MNHVHVFYLCTLVLCLVCLYVPLADLARPTHHINLAVMAAPPDTESLESRISEQSHKPSEQRHRLEQHPCLLPQLATRLLAHKIQSPQEWEAMQALLVLENCMKNCGKRFHSEVGKFRFLNELIKVVSPKYLGSRSPEPVKNKVLELIFSWTLGLPDEAKITDAYQMLKKQGIIKQDPELPPDKLLNLPPPRPKNAIFEDEEKSKMLSRLLNSSQPDDLKAANKLIKEMVQEDQKRAEKVSKRVNAIQERCEKMRPTLFRLASDTEDNDEALDPAGQRHLTQVINQYKQQVKGEISPPSFPEFPTPTDNAPSQEMGISLLDDELMSLGEQREDSLHSQTCTPLNRHVKRLLALNTSPYRRRHPSSPEPPSDSGPPSLSLPLSSLPLPLSSGSTPGNSALDELDLLGKTLMQQSLPPEDQQGQAAVQTHSERSAEQVWVHHHPHPHPHLRIRPPAPLLSSQPSLAASLLEMSPTHTEAPAAEVSLTDVFVPLESIKPSNLRILFHFARDSPPSRPDVLVVIISMLSSAPLPVSNINFQTAAPKCMAVKLQPPSGTELPAFNPVLPPAADKVQLQYTLTFTMGGQQQHSEAGAVEQFPPAETWGSL